MHQALLALFFIFPLSGCPWFGDASDAVYVAQPRETQQTREVSVEYDFPGAGGSVHLLGESTYAGYTPASVTHAAGGGDID